MQREVREETCAHITVGRLLLASEYHPQHKGHRYGSLRKLSLFFECQLCEGNEPRLPERPDPNQVAVRWIPLEDMEHQPLLASEQLIANLPTYLAQQAHLRVFEGSQVIPSFCTPPPSPTARRAASHPALHYMESNFTLPVQHSILHPTALVELIESHYDLGLPVTCQLLSHNFDELYCVTRNNDAYVLRVYAFGNVRDNLEAQAEIMACINGAGVATPVPIKSKTDRYVCEIPAPEGTRFGLLLTHVAGTPPRRDITPEQSSAYGRTVANFHATADGLQRTFACKPIDLSFLLDEPLATIVPVLSHRPKDAHFLADAGDQLKRRISQMPQSQLSRGLCHGDLHKANVLFDTNGMPTLIDWDCVGYGWRAYDIAVLRWSIGPAMGIDGIGEPRLSAIWDAYLQAYHDVRRLSEIELAAVADFVAIRHIRVMGWEIDRALNGTTGVGIVSEDYLTWWIQTLTHWIEQHIR